MKLYLVRHGQTHGNIERRYAGRSESQLSSNGIKEMKMVKEIIGNVHFDAVFTSERERAIDSARLLANEKLNIDLRLNERDFGIFENMTYKEICHNNPVEQKAWEDNWIDYKIPKGESVKDVYERAVQFMKTLEEKDYKNCLAVTHGGIIRLIYCYILGGDLNNFWKIASKNGSISILKFEYKNWYIDSIIQLEAVENIDVPKRSL